MKHLCHISVVWLGLLSMVVANSIKAQSVIATYDISTANAATTPTITPTTASGATAGNLTTAGVLPVSFPAAYTWYGWGAGTSLDLSKYMSWSITPTAGNQIDFTGANATFTLTVNPNFSSGDFGARTWELHASTDGFASSDIALGSPITLPGSFIVTDESIPLGVLAVQTGTVTMRLYGYNDPAIITDPNTGSGLLGTSSGRAGGSDLLIHGTVSAVPEPSTYTAVFGALAFSFVLLTRRHKNLA
jgi:hypothetical protein